MRSFPPPHPLLQHLGTVAAKVVRITGPGLWEGGARPLAARTARGGVCADAHKKTRSKTPRGSARYELRSFLSEWCGSRAASRAALQPRRAAKLAAQRCLGGSPAATQGCQQGCQAAGAGLPGWQRRAASVAALLPCWQPCCRAGLPCVRAGLPCLAGSPLTAALHPVTIVARGPVARVEKESLGVKGHCRVADASRVAASAGDTALIRVRAGAGTSGPAQDPRSLACASPF